YNAIEERAELDRPAAHIEPFHLEGHDTVVSGKIQILQFNSSFRHVMLLDADRSGFTRKPPVRNRHGARMSTMCMGRRRFARRRNRKADKWYRLSGNSRHADQMTPRHQARMAFCAWRRFSA